MAHHYQSHSHQEEIRKRTSYVLRWNTFGGLFFQLLLTAHQVALYLVLEKKIYGLVGTIFSLIYLSITILDAGFKDSLAPFFALNAQNKSLFKKNILRPFIAQIMSITIIIATLIIIAYKSGSITIFSRILSPAILLIAGLFICFEWSEQILKMILQLSFHTRIVALWETSYILSYLTMVWGYYAIYKTFTLYALLIPLLICSILGIVILSAKTISWYHSLSSDSTPLPYIGRRIIRNRILIYINQMGHVIFSANFLVPFFAQQCGLAQAGIFKLASHIAYAIVSLFNHIFGITSNVTFAYLKETAITTKSAFFQKLTRSMNLALSGLITLLILNIPFMVKACADIKTIPWIAITIFITLNLSDILLITYEKLFINEEKIHYIVTLNLANMICAGLLLFYNQYLNQYLVFLILLLLRLVYIISIAHTFRKLWGIQFPCTSEKNTNKNKHIKTKN